MSSILLVHRGALGDFLMAWPSMLALHEHFADKNVYWAGTNDRVHWLRPLGVEPFSLEMRRGMDALFLREQWPMELGDARVFWFVLDTNPPVRTHSRLHVLRAFSGSERGPAMSPRDAYAQGLRELGIAWNSDWPAVWRGFFGSWRGGEGREGGREILLFPGAGHPAKQWPLVQFFELARWLQEQGHEVRFILGPAELDRRMGVSDYPVSCPDSLEVLRELLLSARLVVGNDSGPMHLAGMLGVPGLALFGPALEAQWSPVGLRTIGLELACRPCTRTGRISCADPRCIQGIPQNRVRREVAAFLTR
ncbi:glycosyltransferase family 9 protein [Desulfonatronum sp. SC1]|uniref:glycosyltransferase family 9 protein n=1 Tax=Desulfonatronum sp. SC1 TaxID=2109626 RepID=UPI000D30C39A|nr:glycosyltransferase family 9 protein [Desulfonatronum sp. SC1]PTN34118.1 ADP-heptose--LPS heptosyltransferase [Desulfonatronum sp. SC1]